MKAFHNDSAIKEKYLTRVKAHYLADEIIKGKYWEDGKGCAVGCTIHSSDHGAYEVELGIPEWLARVEDTIFEGMPNERAKSWPTQFLEAIPVGVDLEEIKAPFLIFVLESTLDKFDHKKYPDVKKSIDTVIELYRSNEKDIEKIMVAVRAAEVAAETAGEAAAVAAAWAARAAAWARAEVAAWAVAAAGAAAVAGARAVAAYAKFADKLLELLRGLDD